jgi:hypothetical protein
MTVRVRDHYGRVVRARDTRGFSRSRPALSSSEALFELLHRAGLRPLFRFNWALPISENRAPKQLNSWKSRLERELLDWPGLPNTP